MFAPGEENSCLGTILYGACCLPGSSCSILTEDECDSAGGVFQGVHTACDEVPCCPDPAADSDWDGDVDQEDGDVDQDDFAEFQKCYTGPGGGVPEGCECFDREPAGGDGDIDVLDLTAFENCASGPGIPADKNCDG